MEKQIIFTAKLDAYVMDRKLIALWCGEWSKDTHREVSQHKSKMPGQRPKVGQKEMTLYQRQYFDFDRFH
eukprot:SAG31_NODE_24494_length_480_cov_0.942257_1_plen_69_part_10